MIFFFFLVNVFDVIDKALVSIKKKSESRNEVLKKGNKAIEIKIKIILGHYISVIIKKFYKINVFLGKYKSSTLF